MHHGLLVAEPAIAAAYALFGEPDPLRAAAAVVAGYHAALPLEEKEIALAAAAGRRAARGRASSSRRRAHVSRASDPYTSVSEAPAWEALEALRDRPSALRPRGAPRGLRPAAARARVPSSPPGSAAQDAAPVLEPRPAGRRRASCSTWASAAGSSAPTRRRRDGGADAAHLRRHGAGGRRVRRRPLRRAARLYAVDALRAAAAGATDERRTVHLGIDLFVAAGSPVRAPLAGVVHVLAEQRGAARTTGRS